jgi:hypothetical protein
MSCCIYLRMRNVADKSCRECQNTHFVFNNFFFNPTIYEIMWKNMAEPDRTQMTTWHMHIACCIPMVTNTHSEHVVLIALPQQKWLQKHTLLLCYTYIACLVFLTNPTQKVGYHKACRTSL